MQKQTLALAQEKSLSQFLTQKNKASLTDIERTSAKLEYFKSIVNVELSAEFIEQQSATIQAKLKYLQAYSTLVSRLKQRTDDFVRTNFDSLMEQTKIVALYHEKQK